MGQAGVDLSPEAEAQVRRYLDPVWSVVDVGPGIRPQTLIDCITLLCIEPHGEYVEWLQEHGHSVIQGRAVDVLPKLVDGVDTITAIDVIEHMEREEGEEFVRLALKVAREQVIIFTPLGFYPQPPVDAWGMNGGQWQEHKSGWVPADFPGWRIVKFPTFHDTQGAFFAIHG